MKQDSVQNLGRKILLRLTRSKRSEESVKCLIILRRVEKSLYIQAISCKDQKNQKEESLSYEGHSRRKFGTRMTHLHTPDCPVEFRTVNEVLDLCYWPYLWSVMSMNRILIYMP